MAKCIPRNACLPFLMRFFLVMEVLIGILFIVFALVLQTPPKTAVPIGLVVLGGLTLVNSLFGCVGSCYVRKLLTWYLVIGVILTAAQAVLVFYIYGNEAKVARTIATYDKQDARVQLSDIADVRKTLDYVKIVLLIFVIAEIISLTIAFVMRCCVDPDGHYGDFSDEEARYNTQMNTMPSSSGGKAYNSQKSSIASKYGMYKTER